MESRDVCVTGGAGFIGSHLVDALVRDGHSVTVVDDFSSGRRENLQSVEGDVNIEDSSILDLRALSRLIKGTDIVYHFAALLGVQRVYDQPLAVIETIVTGTGNVFQACAENNVSRVLYASSSEVYGNSTHIPYSEDGPVSPISCYAVSKLLGEKIAESYNHAHGLDFTCLRLFNTYGPRQDSSEYGFVVARFMDRVRENLPPVVYGDGTQTRDFTYIDDTVRCVLLASGDKGKNQTVNIGSGIETAIKDLAEIVIRASGKDLDLEFAPPIPDDVKRRLSGVEKARQLLGYEPEVVLESGLRKTYSHYDKL